MTNVWRGPLLVASLIAVLVIAGCGGGDDDTSTTGSAAATQQQTTATATATADAQPADDASTDGDGDDFCAKLESIGDELGDTPDVSDPQKVAATFGRLADALKAADPPSEIEDEWGTLTDLYSTLSKAFSGVDFKDPSSLAGMQDSLKQFRDKQDDLQRATTALSQYAVEHCGNA